MYVCSRYIPYDAKFWRGKILTNGHLEKFDEKIFDEFHKIKAVSTVPAPVPVNNA